MTKTATSKPKLTRKKKIWLGIIAGLVVILLGWWAWGQFAPRPLGDKLEYLGKEDYGNIFGFDSFPSSTYYYETDMNAEETANYFTKASIVEGPSGTNKWQSFTLRASNGETIYFYIYPSETFLEEKPHTSFTIEKNYVLSIPDSKYSAAKDSL